MRKFIVDYDRESDDLFIYRAATKSKGSIEIGSFVLDFDEKFDLVGLEFMGASVFFSDLIKKFKITKEMLGNITDCKVEVTRRRNQMLIKLFLLAKGKEVEAALAVPEITAKSPALAYA